MKKLNFSTIYKIFTEIFLYFVYFIFSLTAAFKILINFTPFYRFLIDIFKVTEIVKISKENIYSDFTKLMEYLRSFTPMRFPLEYFKYSPSGEFHFMEVRLLFLKMDILFWISVVLLLIILFINRKTLKSIFNNYKKFLICASGLLIAFSIPVVSNFSWAFEKFHKIVFSNDDWLFDPKTDPIINALPEGVFFSYLISILLIFLIILLIPIIIKKIFPKLNNKR